MRLSGRLAFVCACAALSSLAACAPTRGERVARNISIIAAERTPEKLLERGLAFAQVGDLVRAEQYLVAALDAGASPDAVLPKLLVVCRRECALPRPESRTRRRSSSAIPTTLRFASSSRSSRLSSATPPPRGE